MGGRRLCLAGDLAGHPVIQQAPASWPALAGGSPCGVAAPTRGARPDLPAEVRVGSAGLIACARWRWAPILPLPRLLSRRQARTPELRSFPARCRNAPSETDGP